MHDKIVIYNNEKQAIGWATANCDQVPKSRAAATMWEYMTETRNNDVEKPIYLPLMYV